MRTVRGESYNGDREDTSAARSLETTHSLSISDWLDDFINHQPNDELVEGRGFSQ